MLECVQLFLIYVKDRNHHSSGRIWSQVRMTNVRNLGLRSLIRTKNTIERWSLSEDSEKGDSVSMLGRTHLPITRQIFFSLYIYVTSHIHMYDWNILACDIKHHWNEQTHKTIQVGEMFFWGTSHIFPVLTKHVLANRQNHLSTRRNTDEMSSHCRILGRNDSVQGRLVSAISKKFSDHHVETYTCVRLWMVQIQTETSTKMYTPFLIELS